MTRQYEAWIKRTKSYKEREEYVVFISLKESFAVEMIPHFIIHIFFRKKGKINIKQWRNMNQGQYEILI